MEDAEFHELADEMLNHIAESVESADEDGVLHVDLIEGVLTIALHDEREMVLNKHESSQQIWMASPHSGAFRFTYDEHDEEWINSRADALADVLAEELSELAGIDVEI